MKFGVIIGLVCIVISLTLLFLENYRFDSVLDYFKGSILGLGLGLLIGNLYGYFKGMKTGKHAAMKKLEKAQEKPTEPSQPTTPL